MKRDAAKIAELLTVKRKVGRFLNPVGPQHNTDGLISRLRDVISATV